MKKLHRARSKPLKDELPLVWPGLAEPNWTTTAEFSSMCLV